MYPINHLACQVPIGILQIIKTWLEIYEVRSDSFEVVVQVSVMHVAYEIISSSTANDLFPRLRDLIAIKIFFWRCEVYTVYYQNFLSLFEQLGVILIVCAYTCDVCITKLSVAVPQLAFNSLDKCNNRFTNIHLLD